MPTTPDTHNATTLFPIIITQAVRRRPWLAVLLLLCLLCVNQSVVAGTMVTMSVNDQGTVADQTLFVENGKIAMAPSNANGQFIYDSATRMITIINHDEQSYYLLSEADIESALGVVNMFSGSGLSDLIASQIENLPADQQAEARKMLESLGGGGGQPEQTTLIKSGNTQTINGMSCEIIILRQGERQLGEACVGNADALGIPAGDWQTFDSFLDMSWKFVSQASAIAKKFGQQIPDLGTQKIVGVPIRFVDVNDPSTPLIELKAIQASRMPAELVSIPEGYTRAKLPLLQ